MSTSSLNDRSIVSPRFSGALRGILAMGLSLVTLLAGVVAAWPRSAAARVGASSVVAPASAAAPKATLHASATRSRLLQLSVYAPADAYKHPHVALLTLG